MNSIDDLILSASRDMDRAEREAELILGVMKYGCGYNASEHLEQRFIREYIAGAIETCDDPERRINFFVSAYKRIFVEEE